MKKIAIATAKGGVLKTTIFILSVLMNLYSQERSSVLLNNDTLVMKTEGISFLGSGMNEDDSKTFAINDAKRNALEQAGTYLESHTTVLNQQLVKDEIITFSAGLLKVTVLKEERTLINNMFALKVNILSVIDTKLLNQRITDIQSDSKLKDQLEAERERIKQLEAKIAELQTAGITATRQEVKNAINELSSIDWFNKGYNSKDLNQQFEFFSKAIELDPQYSPAYFFRGLAYGDLGNHDSAIRDYTKAIELNPKYTDAYYHRGNAYQHLDNIDSAIRDYTKAIELDPQYVIAYSQRGNAYRDLDNIDLAIRDYTKAIELNPKYTDAYVKRANAYAYSSLNNYDSAIRDYTKAIELDPQDALLYRSRALVYEKLHNTNIAVDDYNNYLKISDDKNGIAAVRQRIRDLGFTPQY